MSDEKNREDATPGPEAAENDPLAAEFAVLEALKAENEALKEQRLRALAETENLRRRAERERKDAEAYGITRFARDMLAIADNFARALAALSPETRAATDAKVRAVLDGVEATDRQLMTTLESYGIKAVDVSGRFDPNLHQAIAEVPGGGKPAGHIVDVVQNGFTIGERLLRPAMVTVARRDAAPQAAGDSVDTEA